MVDGVSWSAVSVMPRDAEEVREGEAIILEGGGGEPRRVYISLKVRAPKIVLNFFLLTVDSISERVWASAANSLS